MQSCPTDDVRRDSRENQKRLDDLDCVFNQTRFHETPAASADPVGGVLASAFRMRCAEAAVGDSQPLRRLCRSVGREPRGLASFHYEILRAALDLSA
jgi:hypothetical protein